jgi:hypothetical protein
MATSRLEETTAGSPTTIFRLTIVPRHYPFCPVCGHALAPQATQIRRGVACCSSCALHHRQGQIEAVLAMKQSEMASHVQECHGVAFLCPTLDALRFLPAVEVLSRMLDPLP